MPQKRTLQTYLDSLSRLLKRKRTAATPEEFRALFERFKNVLDSNTRALETITDMGEKLGGDYLFDIVYVGKAYAELKRDMETSLGAFHELTDGSFPELDETYAHIDRLIGAVLAESAAPAPEPVLFVEDIPWGSTQAVGGKMAQVAELRNQIGLDVPDGFVVTTAAYDEFIAQNGLETRIRTLGETTSIDESSLRELRERILTGTIPPGLGGAIDSAVRRLRTRHGESLIAVRSSAQEEDGSYSFAGQFKTVLAVPLESSALAQAYRQVIASLFEDKAVAYQRQTGYTIGAMKMAVGCLVMVKPIASGVAYSTSPDGDARVMLISASWGLGEGIVEAKSRADLYTVRKGREPELLESRIAQKDTRMVVGETGGTKEAPVPADGIRTACLTPDQVRLLASLVQRIERYFGNPRDIEWSLDEKGRIFLLQARPLVVTTGTPAPEAVVQADLASPVLARDKGIVVQRGSAAGRTVLVTDPGDLEAVPKGSVLVAPRDSSLLVRAMPFVSAIITETGSQTSHMAALSRELRVPTIVNMDGAVELLGHGRDVTVVAGDDNRTTIYAGIAPKLLSRAGQDRRQMESLYEFRKKRYLLRYVSPLHLIDPLMDEFTPQRCRTMHDILRFMHEKAVAELLEQARRSGIKSRRKGHVVPLELPVPAGILVMDMGGGLAEKRPAAHVGFDSITSVPFKAILHGMIHPGAWHAEPVAMNTGDFLSSVMRMPDVSNISDSTVGYNVAVISRDYVNMSIRFGYHFNMVDCYCSERAKNNHIYFRFAGGATDLLKRSRRLELISRILKEYGFAVNVKGDLLIARLAGMAREEMERVLDQTGRLIAYARQLDAMLRDDRDVDLHAARFLSGSYEPAPREG
jgi:pyruvate,water dikinase